VAPLLAAIAVLVVGFSYQAAHPEDVEVNPMSIILAPVFLLIAGVPTSYGVAGVIGMPIAFWLRKFGRLNAFTVHGAALLSAAVPGAAVAFVGVLTWPFGSRDDLLRSCMESFGAGLTIFLALAPFILLSATTFWLVGVRRWK
jgi:hypothetical protein